MSCCTELFANSADAVNFFEQVGASGLYSTRMPEEKGRLIRATGRHERVILDARGEGVADT